MISDERKKEIIDLLEDTIYGEVFMYSLTQRGMNLGLTYDEVKWLSEEDLNGRINIKISVELEAE